MFNTVIHRALLYKHIIFPTFISVLSTIIIGKIIAVYVVPEEYGRYSLLFIVFSAVNAMVINPSINAFKSFRSEVGDSLSILFFDNLYFFVAIFLNVISIILFFIKVEQDIILSFTLMIFYLLFQAIINLRLAKYTLDSKFNYYFTITIFSSFLNIITLIFMLILFKLRSNVNLWMVSCIFSFIVLIYTSSKIPLSKFFNIFRNEKTKDLLKKVLKFCIPLVGVAIFTTISTYVDRIILYRYLGTHYVGMYSASYGLGSRISLLMAPFVIYLTPIIHDKIKYSKSEINFILNKVLLVHLIIGLLACCILFIFKDLIGIIFLSKQYKESFVIIPLIAFSYLFFNSVNAIDAKFLANAKTGNILIHYFIAGICSLILNLLFIPNFGLLGAAFACCFSYAIQFLVAFYINKKEVDFNFL